MVLLNYQNFREMISNMIYIVAFVVGLKCPRKVHLNTQYPPRIADLPTALICIELLYTNLLLAIAILKCLCDTTVCENERRNHSSKILAHFIHKMGSKELFRSIA